jgi:amino-acid N-acetyltransferase
MKVFSDPPADQVRALLLAAQLPVDDLDEGGMHFLGCGDPHCPIGVIGLQIFGADALLRSLAVDPAHRGIGAGKALSGAAERHASRALVRRIFLLTETAAGFFAARGYAAVPRDQAPRCIRETREFSTLCPASAILMTKTLD